MDSADPTTKTGVQKELKPLLQDSYREVLDAVKHQDDKIGRLFTGIAFLTAAALAMANLGGAALLRQRYAGWTDVPPAMLCLAAYIVLVVLAVTILLGSLATPLRVPGLARVRRGKHHVHWVSQHKTSQIYFAEIWRIGLRDWEAKWANASEDDLNTEQAQALVGETHNLAVRTQFKYGRMNEAIALFNLALLFLSLTMILCAAAASLHDGTDETLPGAAVWSLASAVAVFIYIQLLGQVRYTRQSMDEISGKGVRSIAFLRYCWVLGASGWVLLIGSGDFQEGKRAVLAWSIGAASLAALAYAACREIKAAKNAPGDAGDASQIRWAGPIVALATGTIITLLATIGDAHGQLYSLTLAIGAAATLTMLATLSPTLHLARTVRRYEKESASNVAAAN